MDAHEMMLRSSILDLSPLRTRWGDTMEDLTTDNIIILHPIVTMKEKCKLYKKDDTEVMSKVQVVQMWGEGASD